MKDILLGKMIAFCNYRDRCSAEVRAKIKEIDPESLYENYLFKYLLEANYFNDQNFANSFVTGKFRIKNWGKQKIRNHLILKNIDSDIIQKALKEINDEDYRQKAENLVINKLDGAEINFHNKQKILRWLFQKGYESALVLDIFSDLEKAQNV